MGDYESAQRLFQVAKEADSTSPFVESVSRALAMKKPPEKI